MITKERNIITIKADRMKTPAMFDINTGILYRNNKVCNVTPAYSKPELHDYYCHHEDMPSTVQLLIYFVINRDIPMFRLSAYAENFKLADRFDAIGCNAWDDYAISARLRSTAESDLDELKKNFKPFAKAHAQNPELTYSEWEEQTRLDRMMETYKFPEGYHASPDLIGYIQQNGERFEEQFRPAIVYWLMHGLFNFYYDGNAITHYGRSNWADELTQKLNHTLEMCSILGVSPEKEDFFKLYAKLNGDFIAKQLEIKCDAMHDYQLNSNLAFEDDNFEVVVPTTPKEFLIEANYQQNCVYAYYMRQVVSHDTHVVFIRKKTDIETPYITCEVSNNRRIQQYLTRFNNYVRDEQALEFKQKYQNFLLGF